MNYQIIKISNRIAYLLLVVLLLSCANKEGTSEELIESQVPLEAIRYLALGDSYTIGQGVAEMERWPNQLVDKLEAIDYSINTATIIAQTGWTTNNLLQAIENSTIGDYNLVSLLIGVNNQYQNQSFALFQTEFDSLLNISIGIASNTSVFVVSIPDYGVTPFGSSNAEQIGQELDMYNDYMLNRCEEENIPFINITEISRELGGSDGALAPDNLHPSADQYEEWVDEILPFVIQILSD